jgi:hypothetical protein
MTHAPNLDALVERLADDARMGTLTTLDPSASDALVKYITAMRAERDALIGAAYRAAALRCVTHERGTVMHSPPQLLTEASDAIMALTPADAAAAYEAAKREARNEGLREATDLIACGGFDANVRLDPAKHKNLSDWFRDQQVAAIRALIQDPPPREETR